MAYFPSTLLVFSFFLLSLLVLSVHNMNRFYSLCSFFSIRVCSMCVSAFVLFYYYAFEFCIVTRTNNNNNSLWRMIKMNELVWFCSLSLFSSFGFWCNWCGRCMWLLWASRLSSATETTLFLSPMRFWLNAHGTLSTCVCWMEWVKMAILHQ